MNTDDKRKVTRVEFNAEAELSHKGVTVKGEITDLSLRGMYINSSVKFDLDTKVNIEIHMTGTTSNLTIKLNGIIQRKDENGMAIQFDEMEVDTFIHLRNIVTYANDHNDQKVAANNKE